MATSLYALDFNVAVQWIRCQGCSSLPFGR